MVCDWSPVTEGQGSLEYLDTFLVNWQTRSSWAATAS